MSAQLQPHLLDITLSKNVAAILPDVGRVEVTTTSKGCKTAGWAEGEFTQLQSRITASAGALPYPTLPYRAWRHGAPGGHQGRRELQANP